MAASPGFIYTFYSYKGGVGRSMALVNIAVCMALGGKKVLVIDWDLEAPGLEVFFQSAKGCVLEGDPKQVPGIVDLLEPKESDRTLRWQDCLLKAKFLGRSIDLLSAGRRSDDYRQRVQKLDWSTLYGEDHRIGNFIVELRNQWREEYDFILVDSRTGITDIGDVCTVLLPDALVFLFVSNQQNIEGIKSVMKRATNARNRLPVNRSQLVAVPLPSRDEIYNEHDTASEWRARYAREFASMYQHWLPKEVSPADAMNKLFIPYVTIWSFGERIPVLESSRETQDPTTLGAAYQRVATLLAARLDWYAVEERASKAEVQGTRFELEKVREEARAKQEEIDTIKSRRRRSTFISIASSVAVVGVLASIAIPAYQDYTLRAQVTEGLNLASSAKLAVAEYYVNRGAFPKSNREAGLSEPQALTGKYVGAIDIQANGDIAVRYGSQSNLAIYGKTILMTPSADAEGGVKFACRSEDMPDKFLPAMCRLPAEAVAEPATDAPTEFSPQP